MADRRGAYQRDMAYRRGELIKEISSSSSGLRSGVLLDCKC